MQCKYCMDYQRHYDLLIQRALIRKPSAYTEAHHILPKCLGGTDDAGNIAALLPEEHLFAHRLLCRIYPSESKLAYAVVMMARGARGRVSRAIYTMDRVRVSQANTVRQTGRTLTAEHKAKLSIAKKNNPTPPFSPTIEHRAKISNSMTGYIKTAEHRANISAAMLGKKRKPVSEETKQKLRLAALKKKSK